MHGSWGNMIDGRGCVRADGRRRDALAVLRAAAEPESALRLRAGARDQAQAADALELGEVLRRLREHRGLRARRGRTPSRAPSCGRSTAGSSSGRSSSSREATEAYEATLTVDVIRAFESFVDDLSNWYIRRSRRRFYSSDDGRVPDALVRARPVAAGDRAGDAVPHRASLAEPRARRAGVGASGAVAGGRSSRTARCSPRSPRCAASSSSGARRARPRASSCASRCGGSSSTGAAAAPRAHADEIAEELRVKEVEFGDVEASELRVKPNLPVLGPKLGAALREVRERAARTASSRSSTAVASRSTATCWSPTRCSSSASGARGGRSRARTASRSRSTPSSTTSCGSRGACYDRIHEVNVLRKESGLEITDRIRLWLPEQDLLERSASVWPPRRSPSSSPPVSSGSKSLTARIVYRGVSDERVWAVRLASRRARARGAARPADGTRRPRRRGGTARSRRRRGRGTSRRRARTSFSGAEAPEVTPTTCAASNQASSISESSSTRYDVDPAGPRDLDQPVRVRRVTRPDHEQQVDLRQHLLDRPLPVRGCVTDVFALGRVDVGKAPPERGDDLARSRRPRASSA